MPFGLAVTDASAAEVCATAAEAREAVTEAASDGGGCGTGGGVRGVLSRYSR